ncbi:TIR domain-containing protein, partial [Aminobacter sp. BE322]|uniref:TIR domain-containing protein n=1 Tax=unclassified Aminobacter TaxID=2644704 RepID=UPI003D1BCB44
MSYKSPTYVIFDGDNDKWAYGYMKGWKANDRVEFDFRDAHDLDSMTGAAQNEAYVKSNLKKRMQAASSVLVLIGDKTRWLYKYVRWELELAIELDLPIIAVNLGGSRDIDEKLCPPIIRRHCIVRVRLESQGWAFRRRRLPPMATRIMAWETSIR